MKTLEHWIFAAMLQVFFWGIKHKDNVIFSFSARGYSCYWAALLLTLSLRCGVTQWHRCDIEVTTCSWACFCTPCNWAWLV